MNHMLTALPTIESISRQPSMAAVAFSPVRISLFVRRCSASERFARVTFSACAASPSTIILCR